VAGDICGFASGFAQRRRIFALNQQVHRSGKLPDLSAICLAFFNVMDSRRPMLTLRV